MRENLYISLTVKIQDDFDNHLRVSVVIIIYNIPELIIQFFSIKINFALNSKHSDDVTPTDYRARF